MAQPEHRAGEAGVAVSWSTQPPRAKIGLVGDYDGGVLAHQAIERCFALSSGGGLRVEPRWLPTERVRPGDEAAFEGLCGIWLVPASPYRNTEGALWAIQFARTKRVPFLGTCGGFQHALVEYARNVVGLTDASHGELDPQARLPVVARMACALVEKREPVIVSAGSRFERAYGAEARLEGFHCSFGLNPDWERLFSQGPLRIVARSPSGEVRAVELDGHPFFFGTLFQPERRALEGALHPLVAAFFRAAVTCQAGG